MPPSLAGRRSGTSTRSPSRVELVRGQREQQPVLEHAAGEDHELDARRPPPPAAQAAAVACATARWKRAETDAGRGPGADVVEDGAGRGPARRGRRRARRRRSRRRRRRPRARSPPGPRRSSRRAARRAPRRRRRAGPCSSSPAPRTRSRPSARPPPSGPRGPRRAGPAGTSAAPRRRRRATRTPSATARAPRGRRPAAAPGVRWATRAERPQVADEDLAAPGRRRRCRGRSRRRSPRPPAPCTPCSARHAARCAWWCCTADEVRRPRARARTPSRGSPGCRSCATTSGDDVEEPLEVRDALAEGRQRLGVAQVADVVADPRARALGEAERALELGAARQHRRAARDGEGLRRGHEPARAAQEGRSPAHDARDGVVGARVDRPVVQQARRRRAGPGARSASSSRYAIGSSLTLPLVSTSGASGVGEQQVVQRRVGEHHAELARPGCDGGRDVGPGRAAARARSAAPAR